MDYDVDLAVAEWLEHQDMSRAGVVINAMRRWITTRVSYYHRALIDRGIEWDDLYQEASLAVCHALRKFDPDVGACFITYSDFWITAYLQRFLRQFGNVVYTPNSTKWQHVCSHYDRWAAEIRLSDPQIGVHDMHVKMSKLPSVTRKKIKMWHLDTFFQLRLKPQGVDLTFDEQNQYGGLTLKDPMDYESLTTDKIQLDKIRTVIDAEFRNARPVIRDIVFNRIVSEGKDPLETIGQRNNITRERVRQIEKDVKLRIEKLFGLAKDTL